MRFDIAATLVERCHLEFSDSDIVNLAQVVVEPLDFHPQPVRRDHPPPREVVERSAPQHRFLAAGVHGDIAADARRIRRGRVARPHQPCCFGCLHGAFGHHAGTAADGGDGVIHTGQRDTLNRT